MQFEGEHRQIVLRGIERAMADGVAQDGGMNEVINLIPRNGSYVPYAPTDMPGKADAEIDDSVRLIRVHHTSTGDNTILVKEDDYGKKYVWIKKHGETNWEEPIEWDVKNIVFIGNRMDLETANGIEHRLWKNGEYVNQDDLNIHGDGTSTLPYVSFKVSRGIYDGSKVYPSARYVKVHKHFTDADTANCNQDEISNYVRGLGSVGSDAMALLDSMRYMGGITGYVLVAAAWRVKGSDASHPKYVMASPVLLMGAPEIYMKDGKYETDSDYTDKPDDTYMVDMFDTSGVASQDLRDDWDEVFSKLWSMSDSDDREVEDMSENEHVFIEALDENDPCVIRKIYERKQHIVTAGQGDQVAYAFTNMSAIHQPALYAQKYALYDHGTTLGSSEGNGEYKALRVVHGSANVLYFKLSGSLAEKYRDEIDRLCIFVSPVISPYKQNSVSGVRFESDYKQEREDIYDGFFFANRGNLGGNDWPSENTDLPFGVYHSACGGSFSPVMKSAEEIRDEIKNIAGLYKVSEIQLNELSQGADSEGWIKVNLSEGRLATDRMVQHSDTMLKLSDFQPVGFTQGHIFGYNERLHVFNFQKNEVYRLPYASLGYYGGDGQYEASITTDKVSGHYLNEYSIEVEDSNGSLIVSRFFSECGTLNPLVSCADIDAHALRIVKKVYSTSIIIQIPTYYKDYSPIEIGSIVSGCINDTLEPIRLTNYQQVIDHGQIRGGIFSIVDFRNEDIKPDSYAWGKNEIRVSETGTTIFEVDKSYKIGHGEIIALARLSMGLSQDNYSKFPLVVFCTDGVYTLGVDASGQYAYHSQDPLSRVVCTNKNGICEIDGAVLFPSEYGLQMVTTDGVKPIALQAIGAPKNAPYEECGLRIYDGAVSYRYNDGKIVVLSGNISQSDFLNDIQDDKTYIRYLHAIKSVIVYNLELNYAYLIDITSWTVTKTDQTVLYDDGDYPKQTFWAQDYEHHNELHPVQFEYYSGKKNAMSLLVTRPMMLESSFLKTCYRFVLRGMYEYTTTGEAKRIAGMYVFGSLDGEHWDFLNGTEKLLTNNRFHDIGVETHPASYKYMMVVFAANLSKDSHIDRLEITSKVKYNNKLK